MATSSSLALFLRRSCIRHTRCLAVRPNSKTHQTTDAASSEVRVNASTPGAGRALPTSGAMQRAISTVNFVAIWPS
ncbi:MAG: hypothetical protein M0Z69_09910 [Actinomycetota bacterium]|nr:hypothetical protein [Actinomycetota bacterium]